MKILYLEDNPQDADLAILALKRAAGDIKIDIVHRMADALARVKQTPHPDYDIILTDLNVPDGSGLELLAFVRSNDLPYAVVVVTGDIEEATIIAALKAGANDYIIKREDYLTRLPATLETALQRYHSQTARQSRPIHVLYAENNFADIELTTQHMQKNAAHIHITAISTPRAFFEKITADAGRPCDVILLEYIFSGLTGIEILKMLYETYKVDIPVIIVTGQGNEDVVLQATRLGAADYVSKDTGYLFRLPGVIENAFHRAQMIREQNALQRRLQELTVLHTVATQSTQAVNSDEVIEQVTQSVGEALYPDNFGILVYDKLRNALVPHNSYRGIGDQQHTEIIPVDQGITGQAFRTREAQRVDDVRQFSGYLPFNSDIRSELSIPIFAGDQTFGVINVESDKLGFFREQDEKLLLTIASQIGTAIEKIRLFELERQRLHESEILRKAAAIVSSSLELQYVLDSILDSVSEVVPFDNSSVFLIEGQDSYRVVSEKGVSAFQENALIKTKSILFDAIKASQEPIILFDAQADPRFKNWGKSDEYIHGWMGVPLIVRDDTIGILALSSSQPGIYDLNNTSLVHAFAHQAATAINNAQLYQETRQRLRELELVNRVSTSLRVAQSTHEIVAILLDETLAAIDAEAGTIWIYDTAKQELSQVVARGWFNKITETQRKPGAGFAGKVFDSNTLFLSEDFSKESVVSENNRAVVPAGWSVISLPIHTGIQTIGVLFISSAHKKILGTSSVNLLKIIAEIAGNAIHRASLHNQTERQLQQLTALRDIDIAISSSFDLNITLDVLLDHTLSQLRVDAARILLYSSYTQHLEMAASRGFNAITSAGKLSLRVGEGYAGTIAYKREPLTVANIPADSKGTPDLAREGFIFYTGIPLQAKGQLKGVFEVFQRAAFTPTPDWFEFLNAMSSQAAIAIDNTQLFNNLQRSNLDLALAYDTTLEGWGRALELRDRETEGHTLRVTEQTIQLALALGITDEEMIHIRRGALLHDIGKMGIPDSILHKPGPLTDEEFTIMKKHPVYAYNLLNPIEYLRPALSIPYCHHEKWDGSGYPRGLKGEEIPRGARIFAIIDVWDALCSDRPYRNAWPKEKVVDYIRGLIDKQFDPAVAEVFLKMVASGEIS